jgi:polyisoprenoid-binding protein YceI
MREALAASLLVAPAALAQSALDVKASSEQTFYADKRAGNNQVTFESQSTIEDFTGICNEVGGQCKLNPKNIEGINGRFTVQVADLRTGIELRDEHLRSADWMHAEKHPALVVEIKSAESVQKKAAETAALTLVAVCTIKGVTKDVKIPATLTYLDESPQTQKRVKGDLLRIRAEWDVKLSDYGITGPPGSDTIGLKVSDTIVVKVSVYCSTEKPAPDLKADTGGETGAGRTPPKRPGG